MGKQNSKKHGKDHTDSQWSPSIAHAAEAMGLPKELVSHCKTLGWDCFDSSNRVHREAFRKKLSENTGLLEQFKCVPNQKIEQALLTRERRLDLEDKRAARNRLAVPIEEMRATCNRYVGAMKTRLDAVADNVKKFAIVDAGATPEQAEQLREIVVKENHDVLLQMEGGEWIK